MKPALLATALLFTACASKQAEAPRPTHRYGCNGTLTTIEASYPNEHIAIITLQTEDSRPTYTLHQVQAASGSKYSTSKSANPTTGHFIWWSKGNDAILYTTTLSTSEPKYIYEQQLATCLLIPYTGTTSANLPAVQ